MACKGLSFVVRLCFGSLNLILCSFFQLFVVRWDDRRSTGSFDRFGLREQRIAGQGARHA
jgi:hypothetical protein